MPWLVRRAKPLTELLLSSMKSRRSLALLTLEEHRVHGAGLHLTCDPLVVRGRTLRLLVFRADQCDSSYAHLAGALRYEQKKRDSGV